MKAHQGWQYQSLRNVQAFIASHADALGPLGDSAAGKQLSSSITTLAQHGNDQGSADLALRGQAGQQRALAEELKVQHMLPIAQFARAKLRGVPGFAALTKPVHNLQATKLVEAARAMATAAAPLADQLTQGSFPADAVQQLGATADALEAVIQAKAGTKVDRGVATNRIVDQLKLGREAVAMLDPIVSKKLVGDPGLLAGWRQAKRVVRSTTTSTGASAGAAPPTAASSQPANVSPAASQPSTLSPPAQITK